MTSPQTPHLDLNKLPAMGGRHCPAMLSFCAPCRASRLRAVWSVRTTCRR